MTNTPTLLLTGSQIRSLLSPEECIDAVEHSFRSHGEGCALPPSVMGVHAKEGGFHIKSGILDLGRTYFASKTNANFPSNGKRNGLPTIQGIILLSDAGNGRLLALVDSAEVTILRTGAATAVAVKYLSRDDSKTLAIIGCGNQGLVSCRMIARVRPIDSVVAYDVDQNVARSFGELVSEGLGVSVKLVDHPSHAVRSCDVCVTCTPSKKPYLSAEWLRQGCFIAAVGADSEDKQELEPEVVATSTLVTDVTTQCAVIGEFHHALKSGLVGPGKPHAELGEIVAGKKSGRSHRDEVIVFDSTGMALQDVVTTALLYEKAVENEIGLSVDFLH